MTMALKKIAGLLAGLALAVGVCGMAAADTASV
jgi:hypothetical protein